PPGASGVLHRGDAARGWLMDLGIRRHPQLPPLEAGACGSARATRAAWDARDSDRMADRHGRRRGGNAVSPDALVARTYQDDRPGAGAHAVLVLRAPARVLLAAAGVRRVVHRATEGGGRQAVQ